MEPQQKPGRSKQDYETPADFLAAVKDRLGITGFAVDFAASPSNAKGEFYITEDADALTHDWPPLLESFEWGWLNPPFANIAPWARKCAEMRRRGRQVALLVPAAVGSNWYRDHVHNRALVLALNGRIHFDPTNPTWGFPKDCILALYSPIMQPDFDVWNWREAKCGS